MAGELERLLIRVEANTAQLRRELARADGTIAKFAGDTDRKIASTERRFTAMGATFRSVIGGMSAAYAVRAAAQMSDSYTLMNNRLQVVVRSTEEFGYVQQRLFNIAQDSRIGLKDINELYARMGFALKDTTASTNELITFTELLAKATIVSGATTSEAEGALRQLSQGMGATELRGQELISVMEQMPYVASMIAKSMGVAVGDLKKLGEQGKITRDEVFKAIFAGQDELEEKFKQTSSTIGQGVTRVGNSLTVFVGLLGKSTGASASLADGLRAVAEAIAGANKELKETGTLSIWEQIKRIPQWMVERITLQPLKRPGPKMRGSVYDVDAFGQSMGDGGFDPDAPNVPQLTPAPETDPWNTTVIPASAAQQAREMKKAWEELRELQMLALDDLIGDKTSTAAAKMDALNEAVKRGEIGWRDYSDMARDVAEQVKDSQDMLLSTSSQFLDQMFEGNKTAAIASALINTYQAVTKALNAGIPPYNYAAAAMTAAMGMAQVAKIRSTSKTSSGGGGSAGAASTAAAAAPAAAAEAPSQDRAYTVRMSSMGELLGRRGLRELLENIQDAQKDGYRLVVG